MKTLRIMTNVASFGVQHPTMHNFYIRFVPIWSVVQILHIIKLLKNKQQSFHQQLMTKANISSIISVTSAMRHKISALSRESFI